MCTSSNDRYSWGSRAIIHQSTIAAETCFPCYWDVTVEAEVYDMLPKELKRLQTLAPPDATALREAVEYYADKYMGGVSEADLHLGTLLRAVQAPRLTEGQVEVVREAEMRLRNSDHGADGMTAIELRAVLPEAFEGER